jgi:hypothetical protein
MFSLDVAKERLDLTQKVRGSYPNLRLKLPENFSSLATLHHVPTDLERSHDELRGALIFAVRLLQKKSYGKVERNTAAICRRVVRDARLVRHPERKPSLPR